MRGQCSQRRSLDTRDNQANKRKQMQVKPEGARIDGNYPSLLSSLSSISSPSRHASYRMVA